MSPRPLNSLSLLALTLGLAATSVHAEEAKGLWERDTLTGDWNGMRQHLIDSGITLGANEVLDTQANVSGGTSQGALVGGRLELDLDADLNKIFGLKGLTMHTSAFELHGNGLGGRNLNGNLMPPSNVEAEHGFRLFTLWFEQSLFDDFASLRFGQLAADDEFAISEYSGIFANASLGWPAAFAADLPNGGPAYPYAAPGLRLKVGENKPWSVMAAVFSGDPAPGTNSAQTNNPSGTEFNMDSGALAFLEGAYTYELGASKLPGTAKLGAWFHTGAFGDQRLDNTGLSLADAGSTGTPANHWNNYGLYAMVDQMLWRADKEGDRGIGGFVRGFAQPLEDRSLASWQGDMGLSAKGLLFGRSEDTLALGISYLEIGKHARQLDGDTNGISGVEGPKRDFEAALELTYQMQLAPWLTLQPDFQYIVHPGGNVVDPSGPATKPVGDAAVFGLRTMVTF